MSSHRENVLGGQGREFMAEKRLHCEFTVLMLEAHHQ